MPDLSRCPNPYDFANPVRDEELFTGRKEELENIEYYLRHAASASRPMNLALLGQRASGKTSLLNITELRAARHGFITSRIDLDEDDAKTQLSFFHKVFNAVLTAACTQGAFGGIQDKVYDTYLDCISTYSVPESKLFCPFLFPLQYARAMSSGRRDAQLLDLNFRTDLLKISEETNRTIVLLFDECDVLASSRLHLEKLRNIFMNIPGYMLVLAGTPRLFPAIDQVFSPIVRQFKKIDVKEFKNGEETKECITKPLKKLGLDPEAILDYETYLDVSEIHDLAGGRPYEVQLICHFLFKRVQEGRADRMTLDLSVLEDVRRELESRQDIATRPVLTAVRSLTPQQLEGLGVLTGCDGYASIDQICAVEYIIFGEKRWKQQALRRLHKVLLDKGVLGDARGKVSFIGDEFDRVYVKYYARERGVHIALNRVPIEFYFRSMYWASIRHIRGLSSMFVPFGVRRGKHAAMRLAELWGDAGSKVDILVRQPPSIESMYDLMVEFRHRKVVPAALTSLELPWARLESIYYGTPTSRGKAVAQYITQAKALERRVSKMGGRATTVRIELPVANAAVMAEKVVSSANAKVRQNLAEYHHMKLHEVYESRCSAGEVRFHADMALRYDPECSNIDANNLGYYYLTVGKYETARACLARASATASDPITPALSLYNMAILELRLGNQARALELFDGCAGRAALLTRTERDCLCLLVPELDGTDVKLTEIRGGQDEASLDLLDVARRAHAFVADLLTSADAAPDCPAPSPT